MHCPVCDTNYDTEVKKCFSCGYPFQASEKEQSKYVGQMILKKSNIQEASAKIKRARLALWIIGGFMILGVIFQLFQPNALSFILYLPVVFLGLLFIGFGFLTYKLPIISIVIPLILLFAYWIFLMSQDVSLFFKGIIYKIITIVILLYALYAAVEAQQLKKENAYLNNL